MHFSRLIIPFLILAAPGAEPQSAYQGTIATWVEQDALNPPPDAGVLFVGSSSTRFWQRLTRDFAHYDVLQRGFGGSQFSDLNQFVDDIVLPYAPAAIVVFEGTNDIAAGKSPATVFSDYLTFVNLVRTGQSMGAAPIPILYIGITPTPARWPVWPLAAEANALIAAHAEGDPSLYYLDTPSVFLATGQPPASSLFLSDGLHLNQSGYDLWTAVIRPALEVVVPPTRSYVPTVLAPIAGERLLFEFGPSNPEDGEPTASPDFNGNSWNNWHGVDGGVSIIAGEHIGALVTTAGRPTSVDAIVTGEWNSNGILNGGLLAPSPALLGTLAIPTATEDYFFTSNSFTPGGLQVTGLDPLLTYDLRFFASRNASETRITQYLVVGESSATQQLQTSGAGIGGSGTYDGNDDTVSRFQRVAPDAYGQLFIDVQKTAGSFAYLGILELVVRAPGPGTRESRGRVR